MNDTMIIHDISGFCKTYTGRKRKIYIPFSLLERTSAPGPPENRAKTIRERQNVLKESEPGVHSIRICSGTAMPVAGILFFRHLA